MVGGRLRAPLVACVVGALALAGFSGMAAAEADAPDPVSAVTAVDVKTTVGTDFWVALPPAYSDDALTLYVASESAGSATVSIPGLTPTPFTQDVSLTAGGVVPVTMPSDGQVASTTGTTDKGVHVESTVPVSVYYANAKAYASTGYLGFPTDTLGMRYRTLSYTAGVAGQPSYTMVVGTEDGTSVDLTPPGGGTTNVTLNRGQTYVSALGDGEDPTGTVVVSDKPVAVFGGNSCVRIPVSAGACNPIVQQLPPTDAWGSRFLSVRLAQRAKGDTYRVLADNDNTEVTVDGAVVGTLNAGEFWEGVLPASATTEGKQGTVISTSKAALVAQYGNGNQFDGSNGDPLMMVIPPYQQFLSNYLFALPDVASMSTFYINLVVPERHCQPFASTVHRSPLRSSNPLGPPATRVPNSVLLLGCTRFPPRNPSA